MVALLVLTVLALAVMVGVLTRTGSTRGSRVAASALRWTALVFVLAGAGVSMPRLLGDGNPALFTVLVLVVPVVLAALPLLVAHRRAAVPITWACALVLVGLALLLGLGVGTYLLPGALVLFVAAGMTGADAKAEAGGPTRRPAA
ncbi:hypothetical protein [Qaidamihabitans albus]|uniref:hypothetical protein n=1 Tax=Qaidamihabitans albus TaxID=2795733 RepID=UPI0018F18726|nr:hypothetical protein [Qaidamihabitans albus]